MPVSIGAPLFTLVSPKQIPATAVWQTVFDSDLPMATSYVGLRLIPVAENCAPKLLRFVKSSPGGLFPEHILLTSGPSHFV